MNVIDSVPNRDDSDNAFTGGGLPCIRKPGIDAQPSDRSPSEVGRVAAGGSTPLPRIPTEASSLDGNEHDSPTTMTTPPHTTSDCVDFVDTVLDWLDERSEDPASIDATFRLLADRRRRLLLYVMRTHDESLTLPDAAEEVASREIGRPLPTISPERVAEVYHSLYHDHLPRLVDANLLEYDQQRDLVFPAERSPEPEPSSTR